MKLINSEYNFSFYNSLYSTDEPDGTLDINQLIEVIRYGYLIDTISKLRLLSDKDAKRKIKVGEIPAVTLSGIFEKRNSESLISHSGLIQIDIDDVSNYNQIFSAIKNDVYTYVAFMSPSGNGIKVIVKIPPSPLNHQEYFYALERYYKEEYSIEIDKACKDIVRTMLLSLDPEIYCNPKSYIFKDKWKPEVKKAKEYRKPIFESNYVYESGSNDDKCAEIIRELELRKIDLTDNYEEWINIGFALANEFGESGREFFHRASALSSKYDPRDCDKTFSSFLKRNKGGIGFATFVFYAKQAGVVIDYTKSTPLEKLKESTKKIISKEDLVEVLKRKRRELAEVENVPVYIIFNNQTIHSIISINPKDLESFKKVSGFGKVKIERYGREIIKTLNQFELKQDSAEEVQELCESKLKEELREKLSSFRWGLANKEGIKAFKVITNSVLEDIINSQPTSKEMFLNINGLGSQKFEWFGESILKIVQDIKASKEKL